MKETIIKCINICKKYNNNIVLDNINLDIKKGDILGLIGKNGAGKTTLMKIMLSLALPSSGSVEILNKGIFRIGALIESPAFFSYLSAVENLDYYRLLNGLECDISNSEVLKYVGLDYVGKKKYKNFSLGMKQRLAIALAILGKPEILILDEPINGLDPVGIKDIRNLLLKINNELNTTIVVSSHILSELSSITKTYSFMHEGKIIEQIACNDLEDKCKSYLKLKVDNKNLAYNILREKLKTNKISIKDDCVNIYENFNNSNIINKTLIESGIDLYESIFINNTLEQYFFNLIGGSINDKRY